MIFILGSFFIGVSLIKIFLGKNNNNKEDKSIEDLIDEYEIIENLVCEKSLNKNNDNNDNNVCIKEEMNIPIITMEHLNKIEENLENKIKNLGIKKNNNNKDGNINENITAEERIFHTIMKKGNLYNDEYKRTIDNYVVIEFLNLLKN